MHPAAARCTIALSGFGLLLAIGWNANMQAAAAKSGEVVAGPQLNQLEYITEDYPPFNYVEDGRLKGIAVELLVAATALAGSPVQVKDIRIQPWARAFHNTLEGPSRVLFSTTRTAARETLFKWVGPIGSNHVVLLAKKSRAIRIDNLQQLNHYRIGAIRDDVGELFLRDLHLENAIISLGVTANSIAKMLQSDRIDLWAYGESSALQTLTSIGAHSDDYHVVYILKTLELYYAFSRDVEDKLVNQLQIAIDQLRALNINKPSRIIPKASPNSPPEKLFYLNVQNPSTKIPFAQCLLSNI